MLKGYIAQLEKIAHAANTEQAATRSVPTTYTPLVIQLELLFATWSENARRRDLSVAELIPRLQGEFRAHPSAAGVATALKQLQFIQHRDYSRAGGGARVWRRGG